jgi:hypothetical protein
MKRTLKTALTVIGAVTVLVLAANTVAYAATGGKFILGKSNSANKQTTLTRTTLGPALKLNTKSGNNAPLATNGKGKVVNLNADSLDGKDSSAFAPYPKVIRGSWAMGTTAAVDGSSVLADISFGWTLPTAPTAHFIPAGGVVPAGCSGTPAAPNASPGNLCVFESIGAAAFSSAGVCSTGNVCPGADRSGAILFGYSAGTGLKQAAGTWAVRPASVSASRVAPNAARTAPGAGSAFGR